MIIELVGLPGSGKTTFARALCKSVRYTRVRIKTRGELVWYNLLFLLYHPIVFFRLLILFVRYRGPRSLWYTKFTSIFLDYNAKYMKARKVEYAVLDQGHLQILLSLFETPLSKEQFIRILSILPEADHYILFDVDESTRLEQLQQRGYKSRATLMTDELRATWQQTATEHFQRVCQDAAALAPATVEVLDGNSNFTEKINAYHQAQFLRYITFARMPTEKAHGLQIAKMCEAFMTLGHHVSLITPQRSNSITDSVTDYYQLKTPLAHQELSVPDVIGRARRVTQVHHYLHELLFAAALLFLRLPREITVYTRTPLVAKVASWRGRSVIAEQHYWPERGRKITAWLLKDAKLIANSEGTKEAMAAYGLRAIVAHNGFPEEWLTISTTKEEARKRLGITSELPIAMYVGSLHDWKGVDTLCAAAQKLVGQVQVVVVGGSDAELPKWQKQFPAVEFVGARAYTDLGWIQKAADILVVPNKSVSTESETYTSPIKLFAHLASGRPVIVSDLPSIRAIVDEQSVWFFEPGNESSLADVIQQVIMTNEQAGEKEQRARQAAKGFTWKHRAESILKSLH